MKKKAFLIIILLFFSTPPIALSYNASTNSTNLDFYSSHELTIFPNGSGDLQIFINVPKSQLADLYRESFAVTNTSIEQEIQVSDSIEQELFSAVFKEYDCSLGLNIEVIYSKIVPRGISDEFRLYMYAKIIPRNIDVIQGDETDIWSFSIGPMNSTIFAKCLLTKIAFVQLLLDKLPGNQIYRGFLSVKIILPSRARLLNYEEISQRNWFVDLGGGTYIKAFLAVDDGTITLGESMIVTEQKLTIEPAELCNLLQNYKLFTIKYSLPHAENLNIVKTNNEMCENFAWEWGPIPLVDQTLNALWSYKDDNVNVEANVTAHIILDVSGYVGWKPTFPGWWNKLQSFEAWIKAQMRADLTVNVSASAQFEETFDIINFDPINQSLVLWIGWFPVEVRVAYNVNIALEVNIEAHLSVITECRANAWLKAGVSWNNTHQWTPILEHGLGIDQIDSKIEFTVKATIKPSLTNRVDVRFYEAAGPYVEVVLYALAEIENLRLNSVKVGLEVRAGIDFAEQLKQLLGLSEWKWLSWETILKEWDFTRTHDVAISFIQVSKTKIYPGESVNIMCDVANLGQYDESVEVNLSYVDKFGLKTLIETREFQLPGGVGLCPLFTWDTTNVPTGTYTLIAEANIDQDDDPANNLFTTAVEILSIDFYITFDYQRTAYMPGELTQTQIHVKNLRNTRTTIWLGVSFHDPAGEYRKYQQQITLVPSSATIDPNQVANFTVTWTIPTDALIGLYKIALNCYKDDTFTQTYSDNIDHAEIFYVYKLKILIPTITTPAITRDINNPTPILVSTTWIPKIYLDPFSDKQPTFSVKIGNKPAAVQLIDFPMTNLGIYTLWVVPPTQNNEGLFNISVTVKFNQTEDLAVEYNAVKYVTALPTEPIEKGLAWLRTKQRTDGSWYGSSNTYVGVTSLAVLAFLNAGYDETDPTVQKAIQFILRNVRSDGSIYSNYDSKTYETSLAIIALVATRNESYRSTIENAKNWLVNSQWDENCLWGSVNKDNWYYGGFGYGRNVRPDLSNTQFALLALDAAGLPKDDPLWKKVQVFLHRCQNVNFSITLIIDGEEYTVQPFNHQGGYDGGFIYYPGASLAGGQKSYGSMTGAGIWGLLLSGVKMDDKRVQAALNWVRNHYTWNGNPGMPDPTSGQYYYYLSMAKALTMTGLASIDGHDWYKELYDKLAALQRPEGYWINSNSWAMENIAEYTTACAVLSLQTRVTAPPIHRLSYLTFILRSNCLLRVVDPEGSPVGYNYVAGLGENQVPTAIYSGPFMEPQYIVIVNPQAGTYRLELIGISEGPYDLIIQGNCGEEITDKFEFTGYIRSNELHGSTVTVTAIVGPLDIYAEQPEFEEVIDDVPPKTTLTIDGPRYITDKIYVTPDASFTLEATDVGSGVSITLYKIYNSTYDSGWITYSKLFYLRSLADGTYTIDYYSMDKAGNAEVPNTLNVTLFSWNHIFEDSYGRGTMLKINLAHKFFQFITSDKDYGIREATYMHECGRALVIRHFDGELRLVTVAVDTRLDLCIAVAWDVQARRQYLLLDRAGVESNVRFFKYSSLFL